MIIITFLLTATVMPQLFLAFWLVFLVFGSLKDYGDDVLKMRKGKLFVLNEAMLYYPIPALVYCLFYGNWIVFWCSYCTLRLIMQQSLLQGEGVISKSCKSYYGISGSARALIYIKLAALC